jgi:CheY-like chemotaxis protein/two-component sensor histidine kinase
MWSLLEQDSLQLRKVHEMMERQVAQLRHLIDDLLDVSRISRGKIELRRSVVDVAEVLQSAIESVRPSIESLGHKLHVSLPDSVVVLNGDVGRLTQIFGNLLHNAAKYTDQSGEIFVTLASDDEWCEVRVRDTGAGIPPDMLVSIFDPFTQVARTLDRSQGGLGIGLTLVKKLVDLHAGTIEAQSQGEGKGSEFIVRLPLQQVLGASTAGSQALKQREVQSGESLPRRKVLVVDDLPSSADTLAMIIEGINQEVIVAYDAASAIKMAKNFHPDFVFSDLAMPSMDEFHLAHELRNALGPDVTLVAVTGYGQERDREQSREAGFAFHLVKPTTLSEIHQILAASITVSQVAA